MAKAFPTDNPFLHGYYAPVNTEADAAHLHITGEMPKELCGTLYRNGPNPQFAPRGPYHWFGGDGMIHAFHIENGNVSYKNRWVRTPKWEIENKEGEGLSGTFGNPRYTDPRVFALNSTIANTNIVWHGGKLLALEEAHAPYSLDPASLMPVGPDGGYETYGDKLNGPFTAHPKIDPETGEMIFFGYSATGRFTKEVSLQTVDRHGKVTRAEILDGPFPSMIHDFAVTKNWIVRADLPAHQLDGARHGRPAALRLGAGQGHAHRLHPAQRHGRRREVGDGAASYVFHPMNHFETADGKVVVDVMKYDVAPLFPLPDGSPSTKELPMAKLFRWTFDLAGKGNTIKEEQLDDRSGEFPRFDERFCMSDYRHGWIVSGDVTDPKTRRAAPGRAHPLRPRERQEHGAGAPAPTTASASRSSCRAPTDAAEGDGWVLSVLYRGEEKRSDLAVFEATDIAKGPVALAHLSSRVPAGFHGNWRPGPL